MSIDTPESQSSVQVKFTTKDDNLRIEARPILVPTTLKRYGLSEVVNHLLSSSSPIPFSFLVDGEVLSSTLEAYLTRKGLSSESVLEVEYVKSILPPSFVASYPHDDWVSAIKLHKSRIISGSYDGILRTWDQSQQCIATAGGHSAPIKAVVGDDSRILSASMDRTLRLWDAMSDDLTCLMELRGHKTSVETCDMVQNDIVSGSADGFLGVWRTTDTLDEPYTAQRSNRRKRIKGSGIPVLHHHHLTQRHSGPIGQVLFKRNEPSTVYSVSWDKTMVITDMTTMLPLSTIKTTSPLFCASELRDTRILVGGDRHIQVHDSRATTVASTNLSGHTSFISSLAQSPTQENLFASASFDGDIRIWDLRTNKALYIIKRQGESSKVLALAWDGLGIVSGGEDKAIQINSGVDHKL